MSIPRWRYQQTWLLGTAVIYWLTGVKGQLSRVDKHLQQTVTLAGHFVREAGDRMERRGHLFSSRGDFLSIFRSTCHQPYGTGQPSAWLQYWVRSKGLLDVYAALSLLNPSPQVPMQYTARPRLSEQLGTHWNVFGLWNMRITESL